MFYGIQDVSRTPSNFSQTYTKFHSSTLVDCQIKYELVKIEYKTWFIISQLIHQIENLSFSGIKIESH